MKRVCLAISLLLSGFAASEARADVVVNEINCDGTDWIELANTSPAPEDITGWVLTDAPLNGSGSPLTLPNPTVVPANGHLAFVRSQPGSFSFGISCSDTIRLGDPSLNSVDSETLPDIDLDLDTWGRVPDGTGSWRQTFPTQAAANQPSPSGTDLAAEVFDPTKVVEIDLDLPEASKDALDATPDEYVPGSFELRISGGPTYTLPSVGVRLKGGAGSFRPLSGKAAFKVRFPFTVPGQRLLGLKTLTLNNMVQDRSNVHEVLAYEAFRAMGVPAPRTGYAYVKVNGDDYGLYLNLETQDEVSLARWFATTKHLYEGEFGDDVAPGGQANFQVDEGSDADLTDLEALIAAVNYTGAPSWTANVSPYADLEEMVREWAMERYIGHWDGHSGYDSPNHPNNYYLHSDASGLFTILPWGTDQTWDMRIDFDGQASILFDHCLAEATCAALFREAVQQARTTVAGLDLDGLTTSLAAQLAPWQGIDPRREYTEEEIAAGIADTRAFIAARPGDADAWLAGPAPADPGPALPQPSSSGKKANKRKKCKARKRAGKSAKCRKRKSR